MKKKALVIGSEGNIGKPLVQFLKKMNYDVLESDIKPQWRDGYVMADIKNPADLLPAFDWKPDVVFFLAALVSRVTCEQAASLAVDTNLTGLQNVIELTKKVNAHLVYMSTSEVYGPNLKIMSEDDEPSPNNRYGLTKLLGEKLVEHDVKYHGLKAVTLRPFMMYDANESLGDHRSAMIRFATNLALGKKIEVHANSARGWFYVDDAIKAIEAAAHVKEYSIINIGSPELVPIKDLAYMICKSLGADESLIVEKTIPDMMTLVKNPTLDKMEKILGVKASVTLKEGVALVCEKIKERVKIGIIK